MPLVEPVSFPDLVARLPIISPSLSWRYVALGTTGRADHIRKPKQTSKQTHNLIIKN